jgi:hypothetical protein|tara:strand:- start:2062 stop:2403 length:342 start_codon:yes stop_codon:yes gene_type:complete
MKFLNACIIAAAISSPALAGDEVAIKYIHKSSNENQVDLQVAVTNLTGSDISAVSLRAVSDPNIHLSFTQIKLGETAYADLTLMRDQGVEPDAFFWDVDYITASNAPVSEIIE